jgi:hypothetical protein
MNSLAGFVSGSLRNSLRLIGLVVAFMVFFQSGERLAFSTYAAQTMVSLLDSDLPLL